MSLLHIRPLDSISITALSQFSERGLIPRILSLSVKYVDTNEPVVIEVGSTDEAEFAVFCD